jgi:octanoyl-[GcvH]:protein N-octanoyltransferase
VDPGADVRGGEVRAGLLRVVEAGFPDDPALDAAVSRALLERVAAGALPQTLRFSQPGRTVAFGKRDVLADGYARAADAARAAGFEPIQRLGGGRAAVYHELTLVFSHAVPDPDPKPGIQARFERAARMLAGALAGLGVDARVGEVPGEYCPGAHSVNASGRRKLAGFGQRLIAGGAHVGAVVVVDGADRVNGVLAPVYGALGLSFDPSATGSVAAELDGVSSEDVRAAVVAEYAAGASIERAELDEETLALARRLAPEHRFGYQAAMNEREEPGLEPDDEQTTSPHGDELEELLEEEEGEQEEG